MPKIVRKENEKFEDLMRRFKRDYINSGLQKLMKSKEFYLKPSDKRKEKDRAARAKIKKSARHQREKYGQ
jgi:small subunit ribosomal protein S21